MSAGRVGWRGRAKEGRAKGKWSEREREREWFKGPHEIVTHLVCAANRHFNIFHELLTNLRSVRVVTPESGVCVCV